MSLELSKVFWFLRSGHTNCLKSFYRRPIMVTVRSICFCPVWFLLLSIGVQNFDVLGYLHVVLYYIWLREQLILSTKIFLYVVVRNKVQIFGASMVTQKKQNPQVFVTHKSYTAVQDNFRRKFQCCHASSKRKILHWVQNPKEFRTLQSFNSKGLRDTCSGRGLSAGTARNIDAVWESVARSPKQSVRRHSQELEIS